MTTNKPEVVAWYFPSSKTTLPVVSLNERNGNGQSLIRLSDYEALQAECDKLLTIISEIKDWDCDPMGGFLSLPLALRQRIQEVLGGHIPDAGEMVAAARASNAGSTAVSVSDGAVAVCPECDIAGCRHIREQENKQ